MMKIIVLDGYTLNPGDLSWSGLEALGDVSVYDRTPLEQVVERSSDAEVLIVNKALVTAEAIAQLSELRYIGVSATGYNNVDVQAARERGVLVTNVPTYGTNSVAQMTFALLLELCRHVQVHSDAVRQGEWSRSVDFCFLKHTQIELSGRTMGIVGFGRIGRQVARIALAMDMRVLAADALQEDPPDTEDFAWSEIPHLLRESDVVTLHCPLTPETEGIINKQTLALMKPSAFLINTSRGQLVVEADLADALNHERIAGAAVDVLSSEPPKPDNPLLSAKNCILTPHIAWATFEARTRMMNITVENLKAFLAGRPANVISR